MISDLCHKVLRFEIWLYGSGLKGLRIRVQELVHSRFGLGFRVGLMRFGLCVLVPEMTGRETTAGSPKKQREMSSHLKGATVHNKVRS